jgi:hypothetical protein
MKWNDKYLVFDTKSDEQNKYVIDKLRNIFYISIGFVCESGEFVCLCLSDVNRWANLKHDIQTTNDIFDCDIVIPWCSVDDLVEIGIDRFLEEKLDFYINSMKMGLL